MVVTTGVDAAGDLDLQLTDLGLPFRSTEAFGDPLRNRNGAGGCQGAIVHARAGDDIGDQTGIAFRDTRGHQLVEQRRQVVQLHMRQDHVLLVTDADLVMTVFLARSAITYICSSDASPGMPPIGFMDNVTEV